MPTPLDHEDLIQRLAQAEQASMRDAVTADPTLAPLKEELDTIAQRVRLPAPSDPYLEEPELRQALERFADAEGAPKSGTREGVAPPQDPIEPLEPKSIGHYRLLHQLGAGGMGTVYKAIHAKLEKTVALKVLSSKRLPDAQTVARFEREMRAVGKLQHPNIVAAHDAGEVDGAHFLVMELVDGIDLATLVQRRGPLPVAEACELIRQAALGLEHAREHGLVHRDIKPSNLMLARPTHAKAMPLVKVLDLGLALLDGGDPEQIVELTSTGQVMGTIDYMAPEQGSDTHNVDIRADVYSLGATLYKLLVGRAPFAEEQYAAPLKKLVALTTKEPSPIAGRRPDCPPEVAQIIHRMLAKSPADRPSTPLNVADLLEPFAGGANLAELLLDSPSTPVELRPVGADPSAPTHSSGYAPTRSFERVLPTVARVLPNAVWPRRVRRWVAAAGGAAFLAVMGVILYVATDLGDVVIEAPADLPPGFRISVTRDGEPLVEGWKIKSGGDRETVRTGRVEVAFSGAPKDEFELIEPDELVVRRGKELVFSIKRIPAMTRPQGVVSSDRTTPPPLVLAPFDEPPSLADWIKGRTILTVAQDGSGQFKTIGEAFNALKAGQVIEVLDRGPYREYLRPEMQIPPDCGLLSQQQTRIEFPEGPPAWQPFPADACSIGHRLELAGGFRLHGVVMTFPHCDDGQGLAFFHPDGLVLEDCAFQMPRGSGDMWRVVSLWRSNRSFAQPAVIRGCLFDGRLGIASIARKDLNVNVVVERNYFGGRDVGSLLQAVGRYRSLVIRHNVFAGPNFNGINLWSIGDTESLDIRNNTFNGRATFEFARSAPSKNVRIANNLFAEQGGIWLTQNAAPDAVVQWDICHNAIRELYRLHPTVPLSASDRIVVAQFLSRNPLEKSFLRLPLDSPLATGGAGVDKDLPTYIGALPPGPAPNEGDWFTRLCERWKTLDSGSPATVPQPNTPTIDNLSPPVEMPEPAPLANWLRGRVELTVSQDGKGQFKTIQDALNALQKGQVVRVLDRGPYRESLLLEKPPEDVGLVSDRQTVIELAEWNVFPPVSQPNYFYGHRLSKLNGFRLSGFAFQYGTNSGAYAAMLCFVPSGLVVEDCAFLGPDHRERRALGLFVHGMGPDLLQPLVVRDCLFAESELNVLTWPETLALPIRIERNYFRRGGRGSCIFINGPHRKVAIRHNILVASTPTLAITVNSPHSYEALEALEIRNNTIPSSAANEFHTIAPHMNVTIRNNILPAFLVDYRAAKLLPASVAREKWQVSHNCYVVAPESSPLKKSLVFNRPGDLWSGPSFLSVDPADQNYLRIAVDGQLATRGAGGAWTTYVGALPPGPAPAEGDWFTRLRERWHSLVPPNTP